MELFNRPLYHDLRATLTEQSLGAKEWNKIQHDANRVAEVANLIAMRRDAAKHKKWKEMAADVQEAALDLARVARKQDHEAARKAFATLVAQCNTCHRSTEPKHAPMLEAFVAKK